MRSVTGLQGLADSQVDVGVWGGYSERKRPMDWDTDRDGMPDAWELESGLDPSNAGDRNDDLHGDGWSDLEEYLNQLGLVAGEAH